MEPKFILYYDSSIYDVPYVIKEQCYMSLEGKQQLHQRTVYRCITYVDAIQFLAQLNEGQPVALAYSTKQVDNTFKV